MQLATNVLVKWEELSIGVDAFAYLQDILHLDLPVMIVIDFAENLGNLVQPRVVRNLLDLREGLEI